MTAMAKKRSHMTSKSDFKDRQSQNEQCSEGHLRTSGGFSLAAIAEVGVDRGQKTLFHFTEVGPKYYEQRQRRMAAFHGDTENINERTVSFLDRIGAVRRFKPPKEPTEKANFTAAPSNSQK